MSAVDGNAYVEQIEGAVDDRQALTRIRLALAADKDVDAEMKDRLDARIGTYLLDMDRARQP